MTKRFLHVKVPGFGCTYPNDFSQVSPSNKFVLTRIVSGEVIEQTADGPTLIYAIEAGRGEIQFASSQCNSSLSFDRVQFVPHATKFSIVPVTPILKLVMISFEESAVERCAQDFQISAKLMSEAMAQPNNMPRTMWLNEVCHRYTFERSIAKNSASPGARFLESEMLKEFYYATQRETDEDPFFVELPDALQKALTHIETHLDKTLTIDIICKASMTSKATITRLFKHHLNVSPIKYFWNRRLEEGQRLLLTGRFNVSQVAEIIGFSDPSAFSDAYKSLFGTAPSKLFKK